MNFEHIDPMQFAIFLGGMSLVPILLIISTAFLKIVIVLTVTRNAMGVQQIPPNMALYGIALAATMFVMAPVFEDISTKIQNEPLSFTSYESIKTSVNNLASPLQTFMSKNTDPDTQTKLMGISTQLWPQDMAEEVDKNDLLISIPAFVLSELQAGFKIGFLIYVPFVIIDLIVSNLLLALGMQMVAPMTISLPLKILLFVLVDGWSRLLEGLFYSYL